MEQGRGPRVPPPEKNPIMHRATTLAVLLLAAVLLHFPASASEAPPASGAKRSVLVLNSYHDGYAWSDNIVEGLRLELAERGVPADLFLEYLDTKRHGQQAEGELFRWLEAKYRDQTFDLVVASDNYAFDFALDHREQLFPEAPLVFCGVNDFDPARIQGLPATGVLENTDVAATLRVARRLHPGTSRVVVVGDDSVTGRAIRAQVRQAEEQLGGSLDFEYLHGSLESMLEDLRNLGSGDIVFYIPFFQRESDEHGGRFFDPGEVQARVAEVSGRPVYSTWAFLLGHGSVGGKLISGVDHGRLTGGLAARLLRGQAPSSIPVVREADNPYLFDYNELQRWRVPETKLPEGSTIVNAPKAFYEISKELFWTGLVAFILLTALSALLIMNILRRRRIEERLKGQLSFLEILMDTIPQLVCWKDADQRYLGANRTFTEFFGLSDPADVIRRSDEQFMKSGRFTEWAAAMDREVLRTQKSKLRARVSLRDPRQEEGGETVWLEVNKVPLYDAQGKAVGTLSTAENVTREINLERQLLQSQKMEAIGALAGGVAHDFNNILTSIVNSTELAMMDVDEESEAGRDLGRVLKAAQRGKRLVEQIMAFSRPSQEGFRPTNLAELVRETAGLLTPSLPRNIEVSAQVDPEAEEAGRVMVDPTQIYQVLMNLCTNAFQAMRETGGRLTVSLSRMEPDCEEAGLLRMRAGPALKLTVADTGPGIDPAIADKIFDPFFTTKGKHEGTGLGLSVVLGVVKNHGGAVRLAGGPGDGAVFEIILPAVPAAEGEAVESPRATGASGASLLFVEDDQDQLATTRACCGGWASRPCPPRARTRPCGGWRSGVSIWSSPTSTCPARAACSWPATSAAAGRGCPCC